MCSSTCRPCIAPGAAQGGHRGEPAGDAHPADPVACRLHLAGCEPCNNLWGQAVTWPAISSTEHSMLVQPVLTCAQMSAAPDYACCMLLQMCAKRGLLVKPFFDDASKDDHSAKLFGHVTASQFRQCINVKLGLRVGGQARAGPRCGRCGHCLPALPACAACSNTGAWAPPASPPPCSIALPPLCTASSWCTVVISHK